MPDTYDASFKTWNVAGKLPNRLQRWKQGKPDEDAVSFTGDEFVGFSGRILKTCNSTHAWCISQGKLSISHYRKCLKLTWFSRAWFRYLTRQKTDPKSSSCFRNKDRNLYEFHAITARKPLRYGSFHIQLVANRFRALFYEQELHLGPIFGRMKCLKSRSWESCWFGIFPLMRSRELPLSVAHESRGIQRLRFNLPPQD